MQGSPSVISALNTIYVQLLTWKEQSHRQENRFEAMGWDGLKKKFDKATREAHDLIHDVLDRIEALSGEPNSTLNPVTIANDPQGAFTLGLTTLNALLASYRSAITVAQGDQDRATEKLLFGQLGTVEDRAMKFEKQIRKLGALQTPLYLGTQG